MTLTVFEDSRGLWIAETEKERMVPFDRSSVDIAVRDGSGRVLNGTLLINGTPFAVDRGRTKLLIISRDDYGLAAIDCRDSTFNEYLRRLVEDNDVEEVLRKRKKIRYVLR